MKKIVLLFALFISLPVLNSFAQEKNSKVPPVRLGNIETNTATCEQILSFPRLLVMNPTCVVKSFTMTFIPKGQYLAGPYKTEGPALTDAEIALIKKYKGTATKIVIEDIKVSCQGGPETTANTIFLSYDH